MFYLLCLRLQAFHPGKDALHRLKKSEGTVEKIVAHTDRSPYPGYQNSGDEEKKKPRIAGHRKKGEYGQ
jgi:hypothetical protein